METGTTNENRINFIDIAKCIGIFCIVVGHSLTTGTYLRRWVFAFHVPFFFILSGITFKRKPNVSFVKRNFFKLMIPYYIVSIISIAIYVVLGIRLSLISEGEANILMNVGSMLYANSKFGYMKWNQPLWFIPCFFAATSIFNFVLNFVKRRVPKNENIVLFVIAGILWVLGYTMSNIFELWLPFQIETSLCMIIFLATGYIVSHKVCKLLNTGRISARWGCWYNRKLVVSAVAVVLIIIGCCFSFLHGGIGVRTDTYRNIFLFFLNVVLISTGVLGIAYAINKNSILEYVGRHTMVIMLFHRFPIMFFAEILPITKIYLEDTRSLQNTIIGVIVAILTMIMCLALGEVLRKIQKLFLKKLKSRIL